MVWRNVNVILHVLILAQFVVQTVKRTQVDVTCVDNDVQNKKILSSSSKIRGAVSQTRNKKGQQCLKILFHL